MSKGVRPWGFVVEKCVEVRGVQRVMGAAVVIGSVQEEGVSKVCSAAVVIGSGNVLLLWHWRHVLRPAVVLHLRTLRRRTCNLRLYAPPLKSRDR